MDIYFEKEKPFCVSCFAEVHFNKLTTSSIFLKRPKVVSYHNELVFFSCNFIIPIRSFPVSWYLLFIVSLIINIGRPILALWCLIGHFWRMYCSSALIFAGRYHTRLSSIKVSTSGSGWTIKIEIISRAFSTGFIKCSQVAYYVKKYWTSRKGKDILLCHQPLPIFTPFRLFRISLPPQMALL